MTQKTMWEQIRERAAKLRDGAAQIGAKAQERTQRLPELALLAEEKGGEARDRFAAELREIEDLATRAKRQALAATYLEERADEVRRDELLDLRQQRVSEMSDARAGYDHAVREMDEALSDVEDAFGVMQDAVRDYSTALRRAEFDDAAGALQRRIPRMLQAALWANAPRLARAMGIELRHRHGAQNMADAGGFLPAHSAKE